MQTILLLVVVLSAFATFGHAFRLKQVGSPFRGSQIHMASESESKENSLYSVVGAAGVVSNIICDYSLFVLKTTGCGLPAGPFGLIGAAEGVSYLTVVAILGWSLATKVKTGSGLPAGPSGILGAGEGLSFLTVLGGLIIAGLNLSDYGFLPGFLPNDRCG